MCEFGRLVRIAVRTLGDRDFEKVATSSELFYGAARCIIAGFGSVRTTTIEEQLQHLLEGCPEDPPELRAERAIAWVCNGKRTEVYLTVIQILVEEGMLPLKELRTAS